MPRERIPMGSEEEQKILRELYDELKSGFIINPQEFARKATKLERFGILSTMYNEQKTINVREVIQHVEEKLNEIFGGK